MPFVLRTTSVPPLTVLTELEQIVIIDQTGPAIPVGPSSGAVCLVGEFLKGPFVPTEVFSSGELADLYGGLSSVLSQAAGGTQDGSGVEFEGNGILQLKSKRFRRLVMQRVDTDMTTTDAGSAKAFIKFDVTIHATDQDPDDATKTGRAILIPAGTRFGDTALASTAVTIVALSQDIVIPKGTTISGGIVGINQATLNENGTAGATGFMVKGTTLAIAGLDSAIDTALPNVNSTIAGTGISTVNAAAAATAIFAAGTAAVALNIKITSLYGAAITKTLPGTDATDDITVIWSARSNTTIRPLLVTNATSASETGRGRVALVSGDRATAATSAAATTAKTAAKALATTENYRSDRAIVCFPYNKVFSSELGSVNVTVSPDSWMAASLSNFPEEYNPGQRNPYIQSLQELEDAFIVSPLSKADYVSFKASGVCALRKDRQVGWWFQSGVTAVLPATSPTLAPIKRRRMADFIQDGLAAIGSNYNKGPATTEKVDQLVGEVDAFMSGLLSPQNPSLQRIDSYAVDPDGGNTPELEGLGIFVIKTAVRLLGSMDTIVFNTTIGETVDPSALTA